MEIKTILKPAYTCLVSLRFSLSMRNRQTFPMLRMEQRADANVGWLLHRALSSVTAGAWDTSKAPRETRKPSAAPES